MNLRMNKFDGIKLKWQSLIRLGFKKRIKGGHHIFYQQGIEEIINIQSQQGKAKLYQVKQIRNLILKYKLGGNI